jgi:uncharacterized membrane protein YfcA
MASRRAASVAASAAARVAAGAPAASAPAACVSAPLKPGWQYGTTAWGTGAGAVSALTGLGGAVVFVPACSRLGMTAKKIIGTTVVAVTCATSAGSYAYTEANVTDIPAAVAIGVVGAATTPFAQRLARGVSGKTLRRWCGGALLACAPTAFMTKKKKGDKTTVDDDHAPGGTAEVRPGGAAALALAGKADELVKRGGILENINLLRRDADARGKRQASAGANSVRETKGRAGVRESANARGGSGSGSGSGSIAHSVKEPEASPADSSVGHHGNAWLNLQEQFRERMRVADGDFARALWNEREHLAVGLGVGLLQGTVGIGGGVLVTTYMSIVGDTEVHRMCATALCATLVTNTAVCTQHFIAGNVRMRVAAVLGVSAMAASYFTAKNVSLSVPEPVIRGFIATALVASGASMLR